jgi:hypothetical protein
MCLVRQSTMHVVLVLVLFITGAFYLKPNYVYCTCQYYEKHAWPVNSTAIFVIDAVLNST